MVLMLVEEYSAGWNVIEDKGNISLKITTQKQAHPIPVRQASEFSAMMAILTSGKPVFLDPATGLLTTKSPNEQHVA